MNEIASPVTAPELVAARWRDHLVSHKDRMLIEELLFEHWLSQQAPVIASKLGQGFRYDKTLHMCRQYVALGLYDHAKDINWRRPIVFTRTLKLASAYLKDVVASGDLDRPEIQYHYSGRLGVATVFISRFETVTENELRAAVEILSSSLTIGNPVADALPYLLEAHIRLYDVTGDIGILQRAISLHRSYATEVAHSAACHISMADIWLRLADIASTCSGQLRFLDCAQRCLALAEQAGSSDPVDRARFDVATAVSAAIANLPRSGSPCSIGIRGLKNPFGLYEHLNKLRSPPTCSSAPAEVVVNALRSVTTANSEPISRRVFADALSARALDSNTSVRECIALLEEALRVRSGSRPWSQLEDEPSRYRTARDLLQLARLQSDDLRRVDGIKTLVLEAVGDPLSCIPLVVLGQDMEENGPLRPYPASRLRALLSQQYQAQELMTVITSNTVDSLYSEAARRAIRSHDLSRRRLGGRGNALTTEDYMQLSSDVFVFKATSRECYLREIRRSRALAGKLRELHIDGEFGLVEHIAQTESEADDPMFSTTADLITVRRFRFGTTLADAIQQHADLSVGLLEKTARFLGIMHAFETKVAGTPTGVRKELHKKEFGRWLRDGIKVDSAAGLFDEWWQGLVGVPVVSRRDAHAFNWLVSGTGQVLAIDLEASGWRPVGYELAQLTDDFPSLPVSDHGWTQRQRIVEIYASALAEHGLDVSHDVVWPAYVAGLVARAVRGITDPVGDQRLRSHSEALLRYIASRATVSGSTRDVARQVLIAWARLRGVAEDQMLPDVGAGRHRHISRALSYYLRHSDSVPADSEGWASLADLLIALRAGAIKVTSSEILAVASAIDEPRFEVDGSRVRARYGHTKEVQITYSSTARPATIYHGTAVRNLNSIFQQRQGLRPMARQWVHLSERWELALRTGGRYGSPVLLEIYPANSPQVQLYHGGGTTWLAKSLPASALHVVPVYRVFLNEY